MPNRHAFTAPIALALALAAGAPAALAAEAAQQPAGDATQLYRSAIEAVEPAIVQIKYVSGDAGGMMGGGESEEQLDGVLVSPDGLIIVSNVAFGGMAAMFGSGAAPKDIRVFVGDETEGRKASVLARDSDRDLTWIKLDDAPEEELPHVSLDGSTSAEVGDRVLQVGRASEFFGHAAKVSEGNVVGATTKPRALMLVSQAQLSEVGMPVLNESAEIVGFLVVQLPSMEEMQAGGAADYELGILSLEEVRRATENARALETDEDE